MVPSCAVDLQASVWIQHRCGWACAALESGLCDAGFAWLMVQTHDSEYLQLGEHHRVAGVTTMNVSRLMRRVFSTSLPLSVIPALECFLVVTSVRYVERWLSPDLTECCVRTPSWRPYMMHWRALTPLYAVPLLLCCLRSRFWVRSQVCRAVQRWPRGWVSRRHSCCYCVDVDHACCGERLGVWCV